MKKYLLFPILFLFTTAQGQVSYDFAMPMPPEGKKITSVSKLYYGTYSSSQVDIDYEINKEGIWAIATIYSSISREAIRESSKYLVKEDFIFGIHEEDSIPCVLQGEFYHFAVKHKEQIVGGQSKNVLVKISESSYILNFENARHFTPSLLEFKGETLSVQHFTYEEDSKVFNGISNRTETPTSHMNYILLQPTLSEWKALAQNQILGAAIFFGR